MRFDLVQLRSFVIGGLGAAALTCATCASAQESGLARAGGWHWTKITDAMSESAVADPDAYLIVFSAEGTIEVKADCIDAGGTYTVEGDKIAIKLDDAVEADCGPDSKSSELLETLPYSDSWSIDQRRTLTLQMLGEAGFLTLRPAD